MDMSKFKKYSSREAYEVAEMAKAKGLVLLEGSFETTSYQNNNESSQKGYCVTKMIGGQYLTLKDNGFLYQDYVCANLHHNTNSVGFFETLEKVKERILSFDGVIKNPPNFIAHIRVYDGEPEYYGFLQRLYLEDFAHRYGISYKERFMLLGGQQDTGEWFPLQSITRENELDCCEESFSQITADDFLVVTDYSRINSSLSNSFNILPASSSDNGYSRYKYHETEKFLEEVRKHEKKMEDFLYWQMNLEHREMTLQDDQPCIEVEGDDE